MRPEMDAPLKSALQEPHPVVGAIGDIGEGMRELALGELAAKFVEFRWFEFGGAGVIQAGNQVGETPGFENRSEPVEGDGDAVGRFVREAAVERSKSGAETGAFLKELLLLFDEKLLRREVTDMGEKDGQIAKQERGQGQGDGHQGWVRRLVQFHVPRDAEDRSENPDGNPDGTRRVVDNRGPRTTNGSLEEVGIVVHLLARG